MDLSKDDNNLSGAIITLVVSAVCLAITTLLLVARAYSKFLTL